MALTIGKTTSRSETPPFIVRLVFFIFWPLIVALIGLLLALVLVLLVIVWPLVLTPLFKITYS